MNWWHVLVVHTSCPNQMAYHGQQKYSKVKFGSTIFGFLLEGEVRPNTILAKLLRI